MNAGLTVYLVLVYADSNTLGTELVDALALSKEHDLKPLSLRVVIDELG
jgi:hypothetical protein